MFKSLILVATAITGVVFAQLPTCAQSCVALPSSCPNALPSCICNDSAWIQGVACCVFSSCTSDSDRSAVISYANGICQPVGVTLPTSPAAANCSSTSNSTSSSMSMSSSMSGSMTSSMASSASSVASSMSSKASSASSVASTSASAATASSTGVASRAGIAEGAGLVGAMLGLFALL